MPRYLQCFLLVPVFLFAAGCASNKTAMPEMADGAMFSPEVRTLSMKEAAPGSESGTPPGFMDMDTGSVSTGSPVVSEQRIRIYSGTARLLVDSQDEARKKAEEKTMELGGYVESVSGDSVIVRIPSEQFRKAFDFFLSLGRVRHQSTETADVTELYSDLNTRLDISKASRNRLYQLLEKADKASDHIRILKEITRLTEEIGTISREIENLDNRIAYSRISLSLVPRVSFSNASRRKIPFRWIREWDMFTPAGSHYRGRAGWDPGDDYAVFKESRYYLAESSNGVRVTISTVRNTPGGDGAFWQAALGWHLEDSFRSVEKKDTTLSSGKMLRGVILESKDREPVTCYIGVLPAGKWLHVVEIFAPSGFQEETGILLEKLSAGRM